MHQGLSGGSGGTGLGQVTLLGLLAMGCQEECPGAVAPPLTTPGISYPQGRGEVEPASLMASDGALLGDLEPWGSLESYLQGGGWGW